MADAALLIGTVELMHSPQMWIEPPPKASTCWVMFWLFALLGF
jgi:hypothetical protein